MHPDTLHAFTDELVKISDAAAAAKGMGPATKALLGAAGLGAGAGAVAGGEGRRTSGAVKGAIAAPLLLHGGKHAVRYGKAVKSVAPGEGVKGVGDVVKGLKDAPGRAKLKDVANKSWEAAQKEALY